MKLKVKDIPRDGLELNEEIPPAEIGLKDEDIKCLSSLKIEGEVQKARGTIMADLVISGKYEFSCARCLEPVIREQSDEFTICLTIEPKTEIIDLGEEIRQEMFLTLTPVVLCREDCKGLCPQCGVNLNSEVCRCQKK